MAKRVVITGMGIVSPIGNNLPEFWTGLSEGRSGGGYITRFDTEGFPSRIAAEVKDFDPRKVMDGKEARKMDRFSQYAVVAAIEAMNHANFKPGEMDPERLGVILGCGIGGFESLENAYEKLFLDGPQRVQPLTIPKMIPNIGPGNVAIQLNAQGPCFNIATACASGTDAIGNAAMYLRNGLCDAVITGGVEAAITKMGVMGFCVIQALTTNNQVPERASRPFDRDRDGFLVGEGAGVLVLETLEHAQKRGATILAEVAGYGATCDANHLTAPHPEGRGAVKAMQLALDSAGLKPEQVDYINAHGTSTPMNDPIETKAIKKVFGDHAYKLKVSSTKSMTGHCIGAAGGIEAIACVLGIQNDYYPPTINLENPDPECDLDYVPQKGVKGRLDVAMSNSLGFGGHNGVLIVRKFVA
ncbi:MAG TPA: beta-ketoacyl-ACP synthase II [Spirochaetia bacterium]|nr:beta-ketoacyl-ACP synthase II [Spirochaetia bacterium]